MEGGVPVLSPASAGQSRPGAGASVAPGPSERSRHMQVGMIGLGRMGANMVRRLLRAGHECVVFDVSPKAVVELVGERAVGASSIPDLVKRLDRPRAIWLMVPAAVVDRSLADLQPLL